MSRRRLILLVAFALIAGAVVAVLVSVASNDGDNAQHLDGTTRTQASGDVTVELGGPKTPAVPEANRTIEVPAAAVRQAGDLGNHEDLKTEDPVGAPREELAAGRAQQERLAQSDNLPNVTPDAAPSQRGCTTRLVANYSSRRGVRPRLLVAHYTVSPNRPGWDDVWSVVGLFNRPAFAASSNYVIDDEGHCAYIVRESDKAWTQAAANPVAISIEIIATGREGRLSSAAGLAKIGRVFADAAKRWQIPVQAGKVNGCTVARAGIVDHKSLGTCGGGHVDVSPYSAASVLAAVKAASSSSSSSTSTSSSRPADERRWIAEYDRLKRAGQNVARRRTLRAVMCTRRQRIYRAATRPKPDQWAQQNRRARYASLRARTPKSCA